MAVKPKNFRGKPRRVRMVRDYQGWLTDEQYLSPGAEYDMPHGDAVYLVEHGYAVTVEETHPEPKIEPDEQVEKTRPEPKIKPDRRRSRK